MATIYAQFFTLSNDKLVEAMGDRSIIRIDGRLSKYNQYTIAEVECRARKYQAWQLFTGSILDPRPLTLIKALN